MTSKAKAIEAFGRIKDVYRTHTINLQDVVDVQNQLNNPTIDDAIKVVEEMKIEKCSQFNNDVYHFDYIFEEVLTALKGLKEGKEKC